MEKIDGAFIDPFSKETYDNAYNYLKEGIYGTRLRVAKNIASVEKDKDYWTEKFIYLQEDFKFVPGGRIVSNAGTGLKGTTYINCFVDGFTGEDQDSMEGILSALRRQALILKSEGGYGFCADVMRPRGSFINGIGNDSPGAVKMLDMWDTQSAVITEGSGKAKTNDKGKIKIRKGAQMVTGSVTGPDIEEFITAKQTPGRLTKFNMSVLITDEFIDAVKKHKKWDLIFPDYDWNIDIYKKEWDGNIKKWKEKGYPVKVYKTFEDANELWDLITISTYNKNEPGILFLDRMNQLNNLWYCEYLSATNPCLTGETLVAVADGRNYVTIKQLAEEGKDVPVYAKDDNGNTVIKMMRNPRITGYDQDIYEIVLNNDSTIRCTSNHKWKMNNGLYKETKDLKENDCFDIYKEKQNSKQYVGLELESFYLNNIKYAKKSCEECNSIFNVPFQRREQAYCSQKCFSSSKEKKETTAYNLVSKNIDKEHQIKSVKKVEKENVYNGTVDDVHNFNVVFKHDNDNLYMINNMQCGEQILPIGGVCLLGSINLTQFINQNRTDFDYDKLKELIPIAVRFMDNVNDITNVPLEEQKANLKEKRRIGLGIMGYGSALMIMKQRYGSKKALKMTDKLMKFIMNETYRASIMLAKEKGAFPKYDQEKYMTGNFIKNLDQDVLDLMKLYGIRNSHLLSIQPNGNSSIFANVVSGGQEPVFMPEYIRTVTVPIPPDYLDIPKNVDFAGKKFISKDNWEWINEGDESLLKVSKNGDTFKFDKSRGLLKEVQCKDYAVRILEEYGEWDPKADWAATVTSLTIDEHIDTMLVLSKYIDSAMSKTVNLPNDYPYEDFKNLYMKLYDSKTVKGCTTYRIGTMTEVLSSVKKEDKKYNKIEKNNAPKRPVELTHDIHHVSVKGDKWIVLVGLLEGDPFEVFAFKPKMIHIPTTVKTGTLKKVKRGNYTLICDNGFIIENISENFETDEQESLTRMISTALRHGTDIQFIYEQLNKSNGDITSFNKAIGRSLKKYIKDGSSVKETCSNCGGVDTLVYQEGCLICRNCGNSACS